jgi:hypothetical protein
MAALAPLFVLATVFRAMTVDPTVFGCRVHLCFHDHGAGAPGLLAVLVATAGALGVFFDLGHSGRTSWHGRRLARALAKVSGEGADGVRVLPIDAPEAFVLGIFRPHVYVSRGLLEQVDAADLRAVLEHERAHVQRRDPLRRAIASVGLAFHAPGIAALIQRRLARAQEMSADAEAAHAVRDASETAGALVRLTRLRRAQPLLATGAFAAVGVDLEERVRALLADEPAGHGPRPATLVVGAFAVAALALANAHRVHTGFETLLSLLR